MHQPERNLREIETMSIEKTEITDEAECVEMSVDGHNLHVIVAGSCTSVVLADPDAERQGCVVVEGGEWTTRQRE